MHRVTRCRKRPSTWPGQSTELSAGCQSRITLVRCQGTKSLADDLITGQGVVSSRAASILRSVETYPLIGRFVFYSYCKYDYESKREILIVSVCVEITPYFVVVRRRNTRAHCYNDERVVIIH
jgi:hypothetical protein